MSRLRTRGLVLRRMPYSDSSQIVWLFTRDVGVVHALARGALRPARRSSAFPAPLDVAGWYDLVLARGRGDLYQLYEGRLVEGFLHLRTSLPVYLDACFAFDVMLQAFSPEDPHPDFLRGVLSYLKLLGVGAGRAALRVHFHALLLREWGAAPCWARCAATGKVPSGTVWTVRAPVGVVVDARPQPGDMQVPRAVLEYLAADAEIPWGRVPSLSPPSGDLSRAWSVLRAMLLYHLERPPRTLAHLVE